MTDEQGIGRGAPGSAAPYIAVGNLYFESVKAFEDSFTPYSEKIMADLPDFTISKPIVPISEVKI